MMFVRLKSIYAAFVALLLLWAAPVKAATIGFTDFLAPEFWQVQGDLGNVYFANNSTELHLEGPTGLSTPFTSSADSITYQGPGGGGVPRAGVLTFDFYFNAGDALNAQADLMVMGSNGPQLFTFAAGGPGTILQGTFLVSLDEFSVFSLLLSTLNPSGNKTPGGLIISNVHFEPVPDLQSSLVLLICGAVPVLVYHRVYKSRKCRVSPPPNRVL